MKLAKLVKTIVRAMPDNIRLSEQELYASLNFRGARNAHLAIPKRDTNEVRTEDMQRHELLTGEEDILGDVLVFNYGANDHKMILHDYPNLEEAAKFILGGAGTFNGFTSLLLVFDHFKLRRFQASYRSASGARVLWEGRDKLDDWPYPERKIEWLEWLVHPPLP